MIPISEHFQIVKNEKENFDNKPNSEQNNFESKKLSGLMKLTILYY